MNIISGIILFIVVYIIYYTCYESFDNTIQTKYIYPRYCKSCGEKSRIRCNKCINCGYCFTPNGYGQCVTGDEKGPYFREDCVKYEYNNPIFSYFRSWFYPFFWKDKYNYDIRGYPESTYSSYIRRYGHRNHHNRYRRNGYKRHRHNHYRNNKNNEYTNYNRHRTRNRR